MTAAERQRRRRARLKAGVTEPRPRLRLEEEVYKIEWNEDGTACTRTLLPGAEAFTEQEDKDDSFLDAYQGSYERHLLALADVLERFGDDLADMLERYGPVELAAAARRRVEFSKTDAPRRKAADLARKGARLEDLAARGWPKAKERLAAMDRHVT
jgi:hypothetical protein